MPSLGRPVVFRPIAALFPVLLAGLAAAAEPVTARQPSQASAPAAGSAASATGTAAAPPAVPTPAATPTPPVTASAGSSQRRYAGVSPGSGNHNPLEAPSGPPVMLVWTGFEKTASGSRVFLQTSGDVQVSTAEKGKRIALTLRNCRIHMKNNQRTLDTRYFPATPVRKVSVARHGRDVLVTIELRSEVSPTTTRETGPDNTQFLMLNFPAVAGEGGGAPKN